MSSSDKAVWIIGSRGMLGQDMAEALNEFPLFLTDMDVDITDLEVLRSFAAGKDIGWIVNCSAYTAVDKAEEDKDLAFRINEQGVANIGAVAAEIGARVIHISTDYVFDGIQAEPRVETDPVGPIGVYGASKLAGEVALTNTTDMYFILRTSWLYGIKGPNFVKTMVRLQQERDSLKVVNDQIGSPTWTNDLAQAVLTIIQQDSNEYGIYHYSHKGDISWYDFACGIYSEATALGLITSECSIFPCTSDEFPTPAKRPAFSVLSKDKIESTFGITVPAWEDSLKQYLKLELKSRSSVS